MTRKHELTSETPEQPMKIVADPYRINQILTNLLSNVGRYVPDRVEILLAVSFGDGDQLVICVKDNGIGIPEGSKLHEEPLGPSAKVRDRVASSPLILPILTLPASINFAWIGDSSAANLRKGRQRVDPEAR